MTILSAIIRVDKNIQDTSVWKIRIASSELEGARAVITRSLQLAIYHRSENFHIKNNLRFKFFAC